MTPCERLSAYLDRMTRRLRLYMWTAGVSAVIAFALVLTIALAWILARGASSPPIVALCRQVLFSGIGIAAVLAIAAPLLRGSRKMVADRVERRFPHFEQRLLTFLDRDQSHSADPFLPLLAEDALEGSRNADPEMLITRRKLAVAALPGAACAIVLTILILWSPGQLGSDVRSLWTGKTGFSIEVKAARRTIRRGGDVLLVAYLTGFTAHNANLWVRYEGAANWRSSPMLATAKNGEFGFQLSGLHETAEYYAESDGIRSPVSRVNVVDLPGVRQIRVSYPYDPHAKETSGDVIAPAGTIANIEIETDRPMNSGELILEENNPIVLPTTSDSKTSASLRVLRDDRYHVSVMYDGEAVPVSDEHAIEVLMRDSSPGKGTSLLEGLHAGPIPAGYEKAVVDYYKRLSDLQNSR